MSMHHRAIWTGLILFAATVLCVGMATAEPQLSFEKDRVRAEGLTPGGEAVFFAVAVQRNGSVKQYRRIDRVISDADYDGTVELVWDGELPQHSIWAVVDSVSGGYTMAVPEHMTRREFPLVSSDLVQNQGDLVGMQQHERSYIEVLLLVPGSGAWGMTAGDGGRYDTDGVNNGFITIDFSAMLPLHESGPAPRAAVTGATLLIIDPRHMEFGGTQVADGDQPSTSEHGSKEVGS